MHVYKAISFLTAISSLKKNLQLSLHEDNRKKNLGSTVPAIMNQDVVTISTVS